MNEGRTIEWDGGMVVRWPGWAVVEGPGMHGAGEMVRPRACVGVTRLRPDAKARDEAVRMARKMTREYRERMARYGGTSGTFYAVPVVAVRGQNGHAWSGAQIDRIIAREGVS